MSKPDIIHRHNPRAKRLILRFDDTKQHFVLTIPPRATQNDINEFLEASSTWVVKQNATKAETTPLTPGSKIPIFGKDVTLVHEPNFTTRSVQITRDQLIVNGPESAFAKQCESYLKKLALETFTTWCEDTLVDLPRSLFKKPRITKITLRDTSSRWGSCSSKGTISLSWRLIFAPKAVSKYVCIHECCHLVEMNHSNRFWALVEAFDPDYVTNKNWLKKNGKRLFSFGV